MNEGFSTLFEGRGVLEAPTWDAAGGVYFTNVTVGGVHRLDLASGTTKEVSPHRKGIGGLALTVAGDLVVSGRNVAVKRAGGETDVVLAGDGLGHTITGFNDLTVAPDGSIVVGALGPGSLDAHSVDGSARPPAEGAGSGAIYQVGRKGTKLLAADIGHANGIAFAPGGEAAYVSDSLRRCVYRFVVGEEGWSDRQVFARFDKGLPDGMAVTENGSLWLALALASQVVVLAPDGTVRDRIATPIALTTSVHFGGDDMRTAFITSGSHLEQEAATLLSRSVEVRGVPVPRADL
jgi:sugar lactone lactonase YvrE